MNTPSPSPNLRFSEVSQGRLLEILFFGFQQIPTPPLGVLIGQVQSGKWRPWILEEALVSLLCPQVRALVCAWRGGGWWWWCWAGIDLSLVYATIPPSQQRLWFLIYSDKPRIIHSLRPVT